MNADNITITATDTTIIGLTKYVFIYPKYPSQIVSAGIKLANSTRIVNITFDLIRLIRLMFSSPYIFVSIAKDLLKYF